MQEQGSRSIRALARAIGENHSRMAKVLKVLALPERVLAALRAQADHPHVRAHFTEKRLRELVKQDRSETAILRELEQVVQGRAKRFRETSPHPASLPALEECDENWQDDAAAFHSSDCTTERGVDFGSHGTMSYVMRGGREESG
jgi:hypothetical protein